MEPLCPLSESFPQHAASPVLVAPQKPPAAFFLFARANRAQLAMQSNAKTFGAISKVVADTWKALSEVERAPYHNQAIDARMKYDQELEAFRAATASAELPAPERASSSSTGSRRSQRVASRTLKSSLAAALKAVKMQSKKKRAPKRAAASSRPSHLQDSPQSPQVVGASSPADQLTEEQEWKRFTPTFIDASKCLARTWNGGWGGQCDHPRGNTTGLCKMHLKDLCHGCVDGPIPAKKLAEFQKAARSPKKGEAQSTPSRSKRPGTSSPAKVLPAKRRKQVAQSPTAAEQVFEIQVKPQPVAEELEQRKVKAQQLISAMHAAPLPRRRSSRAFGPAL